MTLYAIKYDTYYKSDLSKMFYYHPTLLCITDTEEKAKQVVAIVNSPVDDEGEQRFDAFYEEIDLNYVEDINLISAGIQDMVNKVMQNE